MKPTRPRFFDDVLDAIATLKDSKGTPAKRVIEKIERDLSKKTTLKNPAAQIQKALKFGVDQGLLTENGGNFKLGLNNKEYKLYKDFNRMPGSGLYREHRRRGGRRKRRRSRRRGRRRSRKGSVEEAGDSDLELSDRSSDSHIPEDRSRRRGRKRRRRSGRRGRRHAEKTASEETIKSDQSKGPSPKSSKESNKVEKDPKNIDKKTEGDPVPDTNAQFPEPTQNQAHCGSRGCYRGRDDPTRCYNNCQDNCNCRRMN